ncbi:TadE/TadG family type IV pilus assembly protein [Alicycliphilus sp. T452]|jgi:Flp pilus assembly protein TadG
MMHRPAHALPASGRQRGVAAIEFALIAMLMLTLLIGLTVFWRAFQVQQSLYRAAGDGARHVLTLMTSGSGACTNLAQVKSLVLPIITSYLNENRLSEEDFTMSDLAPCACNASECSTSFDVQYRLLPLLGESTSLSINNKIVVHFPSRT